MYRKIWCDGESEKFYKFFRSKQGLTHRPVLVLSNCRISGKFANLFACVWGAVHGKESGFLWAYIGELSMHWCCSISVSS